LSWLESIGVGARVYYGRHAYNFFRWLAAGESGFTGLGPDGVLDLQEKAIGRGRFELLRLVQFYVQNEVRGTKDYKALCYSVVRSFFEFNFVELPSDPKFRRGVIRADRPSVVGELPRDHLRRILLRADRKYRAVYTLMFMGFMGGKEFDAFNRSEEVRRQVLSGAAIVKANMSGRKRGMPFYIFAAGDGLAALREYLEKDRGPVEAGEALIINSSGLPIDKDNLEQTFTRLAEECGFIVRMTPKCVKCGGATRRKRFWVDVGEKRLLKTYYICKRCGHEERSSRIYRTPGSARYGGYHPHELRDTAKSTWYRSGTPEKWMADFWMGHSVDPNEYMKAMKLFPDWMEETYLGALPWLNILSSDPEVVPVKQHREVLKENVELRKRLDVDIAELKRQMANLPKGEF
jgi:hypothetical protein